MGTISKKLLSLVLIGMLLLGSVLFSTAAGDIGVKQGSIHVLNTGWEDVIILESDGHYALVDAGEPGRGPYIVDYLQRLAGSDAVHLDFVIGTHSHVDHMGGFRYVLNHPDITVGKAYAKREPSMRGYYGEFVTDCTDRDIAVVLDDLDNLVLPLGNMRVTLLNGAPLAGSSTNQESICQLIEVGNYKALLAADMVGSANENIVYKQINSSVDFLKVGHHGMGDSTGRAFANNIRPKVAVYTNGSSWESDSQDATLGAAKNKIGYSNLQRVGTVQYATTDIGGLMAVFGENGMEYRAIKEFTKKGESLVLETRMETTLRPIAEPQFNFFEKVAAFFQEIFFWISDYFINLFS